MKLTDIPYELFNDLGSTKERLKYISSCISKTYNDQSYNQVTNEQLDLLISNTKDLVLDIIAEHLDEEDKVNYFGIIKRVVNDRIERDFP